MEVIEKLDDVRPGDFMIGPISGLVGAGVGLGQLWLGEAFRIGALSVRHAGVVVEAASLIPGPAVRLADGRYRVATLTDLATMGDDNPAFFRYGISTGPRLVQAMPHGAEEIEMRPATHWTPRHAYVRLTEDYPGQADDAAAIARLMVAAGVAYSPLSYGALGAWRRGWRTPRLEAWIDRRRPGQNYTSPMVGGMSGEVSLPVEAICSVLADQSWSLAGKRVMVGVPHQVVTPGALAGRLWHLAQAGHAVWGGAGS